MAVATPTMQLAMTAQQRHSFDEQGFILIENFFNPAEFDRLLRAIDEVGARVRAQKNLGEHDPFALRNALTHHEAFLDLIDNPRILPLVVDAIGWNVQIRTTHLDVRPPYPAGLEPGELGTGEGDPLGDDSFWEPSSRYWLIKNWEDVPLKAWAEARSGNGQPTVEKVHI